MRVRVPLTGFTASPRIVRRGTMCKEYKMPTSDRGRDVLLTLTSIHAQSTETLPPTGASYSLTDRKSFQLSAFSNQSLPFLVVACSVSFLVSRSPGVRAWNILNVLVK